MKILHTSDWHLGRSLYGRKRYAEFEAFLLWLAETLERYEIDTLLVAGDIFDNGTPSNRAQELYYHFLWRVAASSCRHVVIVAGNHDSPSFLDAPKTLLKALDIHVVGNASGIPDDEVLVLVDKQGAPELIICAVPYLRDRDIRTAEAGESSEDKQRKLSEGIRSHYAAVADVAERTRSALAATIPVIAMGHLFAAGGQTVDGDGVRELYVGSLAHVTAGIFPESFDYLALGHLHVPQKVNGCEQMRYSGSPLPMGFGEAQQPKSVVIVDFCSPDVATSAPASNAPCLAVAAPPAAQISLVPVPTFQKLERIAGNWSDIHRRILERVAAGQPLWLEIVYTGDEVIGELRERLAAAIAGTEIEILRIKNMRVIERVLGQMHTEEALDDLNVSEVFERCLAAHNVPAPQRPQLLHTYQQTLLSLDQDDKQAE